MALAGVREESSLPRRGAGLGGRSLGGVGRREREFCPDARSAAGALDSPALAERVHQVQSESSAATIQIGRACRERVAASEILDFEQNRALRESYPEDHLPVGGRAAVQHT